MIIYIATNIVNGKRYVGQTINSLRQRKNEHISSSRVCYFHSALKKYGISNFDWMILHECNNIDDLNKLETHYIKVYNTFVDSGDCDGGYNLTTGGTNKIVSEETRKKISKSQKRRVYDSTHMTHLDRIRPLTKKWHASVEGRKWHSDHAKGEMSYKIENYCRECGILYMAKTISSKYCHANCKAKHNRRVRKEKSMLLQI